MSRSKRAGQPWRKVSMKGEPDRWARSCGLVQMYVQDHPLETVRTMRFTYEVIINDKRHAHGFKSSHRAAKAKASFSAHYALLSALEMVAGTNIEKWPLW